MSTKKIAGQDIPSISDIEDDFIGDKLSAKDIEGVSVVIWKAKIEPSKFRDEKDPNREYATLQISSVKNANEKKENADKYIFRTGSKIIINQMRKCQSKFPVYGTLRIRTLDTDPKKIWMKFEA